MSARSLPTSLVATLGGLLVVAMLAIGVSTDAVDPFDRAVIDVVRAQELRAVGWPLRWVTELGSTGAVTMVALLTALVGVLIGPWRHGVIGAAVIGLASAGNQALKAFIARARPDLLEPVVVEHGFSFPSGHSLLGMVAWGILAVLVSRSRMPTGARHGLVVAIALLVFLIGLSRIWLGVHFPSDVLAGWTAGAVIVLLYARLTRRVSPAPAAAAVDVDPGPPRSDPPGAG
jgi:undecaprenyl-diphosphatase